MIAHQSVKSSFKHICTDLYDEGVSVGGLIISHNDHIQGLAALQLQTSLVSSIIFY